MYIVTHSVLEGDDQDLEETFCKSVEFKGLIWASNYFNKLISSIGDSQEVDPNNNNYEVIRCFKKQVGKKEYYYQFGITYKFEEA